MAINRSERSRFAVALYGLINGHLSDDAFESLVGDYPRSRSEYESQSWKVYFLGEKGFLFEDSFVQYLFVLILDLLVDDFRTIYFCGKDEMCPHWRSLFERAILFLETDLEFYWTPDQSKFVWRSTSDCVDSHRVSKGAVNRLGEEYWPFKSRTDLEIAQEARNASLDKGSAYTSGNVVNDTWRTISIVRRERDQFAILFYGLINGYLSDDAYVLLVCNYPRSPSELQSAQREESLPRGRGKDFKDSFVNCLWGLTLEWLVEDSRTVFYKGKEEIRPDWRCLFERAVLYLEVDLQFEWTPDESQRIWKNTSDCVGSISSNLGILGRWLPFLKTSKRSESLANLQSDVGIADAKYWPFKSNAEIEGASKDRLATAERLREIRKRNS